MPTTDQLFSPGALADALALGHVRVQRHPELPLTIYNYTEQCAYSGAWNAVTLACRGLITDEQGAILARPLPKFFNHDQPEAPVIALDEPVVVTDKADGSLGIVYPTPDGPAVATRGSFASDQALHATALLRSRYGGWNPPESLTVLVEIVYPANRIVLDYAGLDDLLLLGAVDVETGRTFGPSSVPDWPGPAVEVFEYPTFGSALAAPARDDREGLVVHAPASDVRVKIKYSEYVHLHRIITGLSARRVWEAMGEGIEVEVFAAPLPDEFHPWVRDVAARLTEAAARREVEIDDALGEVRARLPDEHSRKDFALIAAAHPLRAHLFARLDGRSTAEKVWDELKPDADDTPHTLHTSETA